MGEQLKKIVDGVAVSWQNLHVSLPPKKSLFCRKATADPVTILNNVSGVVQPGTLLAVMGASGSGKSTLLNVLTSRITSKLLVSGVVKVNGKRIGGDIAKISAYVQQDDLFFGVLTVREHLWFQAMLRMDPEMSALHRQQRIDEVLCELGLTKCANSAIGNPVKGNAISGGERKRLSFASEILNDPAVLFCDEPTSGLDAFMAESVVQTLRGMATQGKTILCTIHQPSSQVFALFDNLMLLSHGNLVFMGTTAEASQFFASVGMICPPNFNPADFYINSLATIPGREKESLDRVKKISLAFTETEIGRKLVECEPSLPEVMDFSELEIQPMTSPSFTDSIETVDVAPSYKTGSLNQFRHVVWRSFVTSLRAREIFAARIAQTLVIAIFTGLLYLRQNNDQKGVHNINGAIFLIITNSTFGNAYAVLHTFPTDLAIVKREHHAGMYSTFIYYISKILVDALHFTLLPALFAVILYWMVGLRSDAEAFFIFVATVVYVTHVVVSLGYLISGAAGDVAVATVIASPIIVILMLFSGFIVNDASIPVYFVWLAYISWFKYANEILCVNQWHNFGSIGCEFKEISPAVAQISNDTVVTPEPRKNTVTSRCFADGEQVLTQLNYSIDNYLRDFVALAALLIVFRLAAYVCLVLRVGRLRTIRPLRHEKQTLSPATSSETEPNRVSIA